MRMTDKSSPGLWMAVTVFLGLLSACGGQNGSENPGATRTGNDGQGAVEEPVMLFDTLEHDFGTIIEGEQVVCYFDYVNNGIQDLVISSVEAGCGCTTPQWSREPLGSGERQRLQLIFDATGRSGVQRKQVTVRSNASDPVIRLTVRANIINGV